MRTAISSFFFAVATIAFPAVAEDRSARFVQMMSYLPDAAISNRSPLVPEFVDYEAAASVITDMLAAGTAEVVPEARRSMGGPLAKAPQGQDWTPRVGFGRNDLRAGVLVDDPESRARVLLLPPEVMPRIVPVLLANGYAVTDDRGFPAYWRGDDDLREYRELRSKDDPFTYPLPVSSRIALDGDVLMQSSTWPMLEAMFATSETSQALTAFGQVLDLPDWGDRKLIHASVFSDPSVFAPRLNFSKDLAPMDASVGGVPYWSNVMLADLGGGTSDLTLVVLLYPAQADAEAAAKAMEGGMGGLVLPSFGNVTVEAEIGKGRAMVTGNGPYAAVYAVETKADIRSPTSVRNQGFHVLMTAAFSGELSLLGPTMP